MSLTKNSAHADVAVSRLLQQMKGKPRMEAAVRAFLDECQGVEDVLWDLFAKRFIDAGEGEQLDLLGRIMDEPRGGLVDVDYRVFLRAKIRVLRTDGKLENLLLIMVLVLGENNPIQARELDPAALELEAEEQVTIDAQRLFRLLEQADPAAVSLRLIVTRQLRSNTLIFSSLYGTVTTTTSQRPGSADGTPAGGKTASIYG